MEITNVRLSISKNILSESNVRAFASVTFDSEFALNDLKVIEGKNGMFIGFPRRKKANGDMADIAFPITAEGRSKITEAILKVYNDKNKA